MARAGALEGTLIGLSGFACIGSSPGPGSGPKDLQIKFFIQLSHFAAKPLGEQLGGHIAQDAVVARGVLAEGDGQLRSHQARVAGLGK